MHTPPNERSQRKQRNTPKNTAPFEARTSLGCWEKKCFFAVLMLDFRKEIFGFRTDLIITEKQRGKRLCGGVGALLKSRGARGLRPRGQGRLMERGPKCCRDNIWIPLPPPFPLQRRGSIYTSGESSIVNSGDLRYLNINVDLFIYCSAYRTRLRNKSNHGARRKRKYSHYVFSLHYS